MNSDNFKIISVNRNIISIEILDPRKFDSQFNIGSFMKIPYAKNGDNYIVGVIENYKIQSTDNSDPQTKDTPPNFIIEVRLVGTYAKAGDKDKYTFKRGASGIPIPPNNGIEIFSEEDFENIFSSDLENKEKFIFSTLAENENINVPVNGNKFFNKHFAVVGSTGSGKSHAIASIIQKAILEKESEFEGLNNSHVVIFDIHGEYKKAFPKTNHIDIANIKIPYWLFDSEELADLFIESNEENSHNQVSVFKTAVTHNKIKHNSNIKKNRIFFDSPLKFNIKEVICYIKNLNNEVVGRGQGENCPKLGTGGLIKDRFAKYFDEELEFCEQSTSKGNKATSGPYKGDFERFIIRLENNVHNPRLNFIFNENFSENLPEILQQLIGYKENEQSNVTIIDLSGIPFEVLSITVSLISRLLFDYGYSSKKMPDNNSDCRTPLLVVFEEAHKYVPKSDLVKYRASKNAIERIAKEGRKYGVTLGIVSQRPSEISETIFSQCNNFLAMRLTNPDDQNYVKRLLPDALGDLTTTLPTLQSGEGIIIGDSILLPSLVKIDMPKNKPESSDIRYLELWKEKWKSVEFDRLAKEMKGLGK